MNKITIYTDGACLGNPGPGGWAAILKFDEYEERRFSIEEQVICGGYRMTTNNRMELISAIKSLQKVLETSESRKIEILSDSQYLCNAFEKGWIKKWKSLGWRKSNGDLPNADLWQTLDALILNNNFNIKFTWVRGHNGNPMNERCDFLANRESGKNNLPVDEGYERLGENRTATYWEQVPLMPNNSVNENVPICEPDDWKTCLTNKETCRIYLASPYSSSFPSLCEERYEAACKATAQMINEGYQVFSPIAHSHPIAINHSLPGDFQFWRKWCLSFLESWATHFVILTLDGWKESKGIKAEMDFALAKGLKVLSIRP